jgi:AcrR family transcriptional regulator
MASDTKERILDVAERLFADRGFPATSLRDITSEAGVNIASVNYHFGCKEALMAAALERRLKPINALRLEQLDELERASGGGPPDLEGVLRAFLAPPFRLQADWGESGRNFLRLIGRIHSETNAEFRASVIQQFDTVFMRFTRAVQHSLPHLGESEVAWRMFFLVGSMAQAMLWSDSLAMVDKGEARDPDDLLESLVQFGTAGMGSPAPVGVPVRTGGRA